MCDTVRIVPAPEGLTALCRSPSRSRSRSPGLVEFAECPLLHLSLGSPRRPPVGFRPPAPRAGFCRRHRDHTPGLPTRTSQRHGSEWRFPKQNFNRAARKHSSRRSKARESAVCRASFLRGSSEPLLAANQRGCLRCGVGCFPNTHSWAWPSLRMWHLAAWTRHCPSPARRAATSVSYR